MERYKFPKRLRLDNDKKFRDVFQNSKSILITDIMILYRRNFLEYPRMGICISKKVIKSAHERNRIKRLIRESFRLHQNYLKSIDFIVIIKKSLINKNNHSILNILKILWTNFRIMEHDC
ncbi:MAG: ribonuclease P protein component [Candidatus Dasytiphilus stammeri]